MIISLDTNVFISVHNKESNSDNCELILNMIQQKKWDCSISTIVLSEILVGYYNQQEITEAEQFTIMMERNYSLQPITTEIAQLGAKYRADFRLKLPDALIIASGITNNVEVIISDDIKMQKKMPVTLLSVEEFIKQYKLRE